MVDGSKLFFQSLSSNIQPHGNTAATYPATTNPRPVLPTIVILARGAAFVYMYTIRGVCFISMDELRAEKFLEQYGKPYSLAVATGIPTLGGLLGLT